MAGRSVVQLWGRLHLTPQPAWDITHLFSAFDFWRKFLLYERIFSFSSFPGLEQKCLFPIFNAKFVYICEIARKSSNLPFIFAIITYLGPFSWKLWCNKFSFFQAQCAVARICSCLHIFSRKVSQDLLAPATRKFGDACKNAALIPNFSEVILS